MEKTKFTEAQVVFAIKQSQIGVSVGEICRKMGNSQAIFCNRKLLFDGETLSWILMG